MKGAWILVGCGGACLLLSAAVLLVSLLVPIFNAPNADFEEAVPFLAGGCCCGAVSVVMVLVGLMLMVLGRQER